MKKTEPVPAPGPAVERLACGIREEFTETEPIEIKKAFNSGVIGFLCIQMSLVLFFCSSNLFFHLHGDVYKFFC
jgi:hypothetical protein